MKTILFNDYWENITGYYYSNGIQNRNRKSTSIWKWLEEDYGARRTGYESINGLIMPTKLTFEHDEDLVAFELTIGKVCIEPS